MRYSFSQMQEIMSAEGMKCHEVVAKYIKNKKKLLKILNAWLSSPTLCFLISRWRFRLRQSA